MKAEGTTDEAGTTRERLLEAAARLFAERGRDGVSIRDIAAEAGVRHGCINYHFRSKDELYHDVLMTYCARDRVGLFPADYPADWTTEQLRGALVDVVRTFVELEVKPLSEVAAGLLRWQLATPEGPDRRLFEQVVRPNQRALAGLLGRIFPALSERERRVAAFNIASQCLFLRVARPVALELFGVEEFDAELSGLIARRIVETALSGLARSVEVAS